jgi:hypothetical protein
MNFTHDPALRSFVVLHDVLSQAQPGHGNWPRQRRRGTVRYAGGSMPPAPSPAIAGGSRPIRVTLTIPTRNQRSRKPRAAVQPWEAQGERPAAATVAPCAGLSRQPPQSQVGAALRAVLDRPCARRSGHPAVGTKNAPQGSNKERQGSGAARSGWFGPKARTAGRGDAATKQRRRKNCE